MIYLILYAIIAGIICICLFLSHANDEDKIYGSYRYRYIGIIILIMLFGWVALPLILLEKLCQIKIK